MASAAGPQFSGDLRTTYLALVDGFLALNSTIDEKLKVLEAKEEQWNRTMAEAATGKDKVKLNIGGRVFASSRATLLLGEGTFLHELLGTPGRWQPSDEDGSYFIDRDPFPFEDIMASLSSGKPPDYHALTPEKRQQLQEEVDYYQLSWVVIPKPVRWDTSRCGSWLAVSKHGQVVTRTREGPRSNCAVVATCEVPVFKVRIWTRESHGTMMVGFAKSTKFDEKDANFDKSGWFIDSSTGQLVSALGGAPCAISGAMPEDALLEVQLNRATSRITFVVNGVTKAWFSSVPSTSDPILPFVEIAGPGSVELVD